MGMVIPYNNNLDSEKSNRVQEKIILKGNEDQNKRALSLFKSLYPTPHLWHISSTEIIVTMESDCLEKFHYILATLPFEFEYHGKVYKPSDKKDFIDKDEYERKSTHLQSKTINNERGDITLYYRNAKLPEESKDKLFAAATKDSISFQVYTKSPTNNVNLPPQILRITIKKGLISIKENGKLKYLPNSFSEYFVHKVDEESEIFLPILVQNKYKKGIKQDYVSENLLSDAGIPYNETSVVESEKDLKMILGDYYLDFIKLFDTTYREGGLFVTPTDNYYNRQEETEKIKKEKNVLTDDEAIQEAVEKNKHVLAQLAIQTDVISGFDFSLPQLANELCEKNKVLLEKDPIASFMLSILKMFVADSNSLDPKQKDKYVPISLFYNIYIPTIQERSPFRYSDSNSLYKYMTLNTSYENLGIVIQLYSIFQRVLLGEIEPTREAIINAFKEVDVINIYRSQKQLINNIVDLLVENSEKLSTTDNIEERQQILEKMQYKIFPPIYAQQILGTRLYAIQIPTVDARDNEICERILKEQIEDITKKSK